MRSLARALAPSAVLLTMAQGVLAQPSADGEAKALALFKEAVAALDKQDFASACPRFEAAMKLFPSPSTQINIAKCLEHDGKIASAWAAYQRVLVLNHGTTDPTRRAALDQVARSRSESLEASLPRLRIVATGAPPGLRVIEGPQELPSATFGIALPTDPGPHELVASAPGYEDLHITVTAEKGKQADVPIVLKPVTAKAVEIAPPPPRPIPEIPRPKPQPQPARSAPAWAWASGGLGIVALGIGAGFGGLALGKQSAMATACGGQFPRCRSDATTMSNVRGLEDARNTDRGVFIGLAAAGVVGIGAGVIGLTAGRKAKDGARAAGLVVSPFASSGGGGLMAGGGF